MMRTIADVCAHYGVDPASEEPTRIRATLSEAWKLFVEYHRDCERDAIRRVARKYAAARDLRMAQLKEELAAHDELLGVMRQFGVEVYEFDGLRVSLEKAVKARVRRQGGAAEGEE